MDIRKVKKLIELLEESGIAEIEISEGEESVRISRYPQGGFPSVQMAPAGPAPNTLSADSQGARQVCEAYWPAADAAGRAVVAWPEACRNRRWSRCRRNMGCRREPRAAAGCLCWFSKVAGRRAGSFSGTDYRCR